MRCGRMFCGTSSAPGSRYSDDNKSRYRGQRLLPRTGRYLCSENESDYDAFYEDTMHAGHYENTPESVDIMIRSSRNVINQLIAWGVDFRRDENGELCYTKEGAHSTNRILFHDDVTGKEITSKLLAQVKSCRT